MRSRKLKCILAMWMILLLLASTAACTAGTETQGTVPEPAATEAPAAQQPSDSPEPASGADMSVLRVGISGDVDTVDPGKGSNTRATEAIVNLYDQLFTYGTEEGENGIKIGDTSVSVGSLVKDWSVDETGMVYTFTLRDDVFFSSGNQMTAKDVEYSFNRCLNYLGEGAPTFNMTVLCLETVQVIDEFTFVMDLTDPSPYVLNVLTMSGCSIVDSAVFAEHATADDPWATEWAAKNAAGSGPWVLKEWDAGVSLTFAANENYWNYNVAYDTMVWSVIPDISNQVMMIINGELDVIEAVPASYLEQLSAADVDIFSLSSENVSYLWYCQDPGQGPLGDPAVRKAISLAIPYDDIINYVYYGSAQMPYSIFPVGMPAHTDAYWAYNTDLEGAKTALAATDYASGFEFTLNICNAFEHHKTIAELIQNSLAQIGVTMHIQQLDNAAFNDAKETGDAYIADMLGWVNDPSYLMNYLFVAPSSANANAVNFRYHAEFNGLIENSQFMTDLTQREANYVRIQEILMEELPIVPLAQVNYNLVTSPGMTGFTFYFDELMRFGEFTK